MFQARRVDRRFEGQTELVPRRLGRQGRLLGPVVMEPQGLWGCCQALEQEARGDHLGSLRSFAADGDT